MSCGRIDAAPESASCSWAGPAAPQPDGRAVVFPQAGRAHQTARLLPLSGVSNCLMPLVGSSDWRPPLSGESDCLMPLSGLSDWRPPLSGVSRRLMPLSVVPDCLMPLSGLSLSVVPDCLTPLLGLSLSVVPDSLMPLSGLSEWRPPLGRVL